jgi:hypothetical protein
MRKEPDQGKIILLFLSLDDERVFASQHGINCLSRLHCSFDKFIPNMCNIL